MDGNDKSGGHSVPPESRLSGAAIGSLILGLLSLGLFCLTGLPAAVLGGIAIRQIKRGQGRLRGMPLAIIGILLGLGSTALLCVLGGAVAYESAQMTLAQNRLEQVSRALHHYHDHYRAFPITGIEFGPPSESEPQPIHNERLSWRVRVLRYLEMKDSLELYELFNLDEPWDSPQNKRLIDKMPDVFRTPGRSSPPGTTRVQAIVYPRAVDGMKHIDQELISQYGGSTVFDNARRSSGRVLRINVGGVKITQITDGTLNTLAIVEADEPVIWTKPDDWELHLDDPQRGLGNVRFSGFFGVNAAGDVHFLPSSLDDDTLRRLFVINDGFEIEPSTSALLQRH